MNDVFILSLIYRVADHNSKLLDLQNYNPRKFISILLAVKYIKKFEYLNGKLTSSIKRPSTRSSHDATLSSPS